MEWEMASLKLFLLIYSLLTSFSLGIFAEEPLDRAVKKIDLQLEGEEMAVVCLPLTNGEAMLMKHAAGPTILVNTGGAGTEKQIQTWLNRLHVHKIDTILLTNVHRDFSFRFSSYKEKYHVKQVIAGINRRGVTSVWKEGEHHALLPNLMVDVLADDGGDLTLRFQYGRLCLLYMASDDAAIEKRLMKIALKDVNVLKIANFAQHNHLSVSLLKHIDPQAAIIFHKDGVQPDQQLLEKFYKLWIDMYQVHQTGILMMKCDLSHYEIITF
jgi:competence protein ComEC